MKIIFDEYTWRARIFPAVLVASPIYLFLPFISAEFNKFVTSLITTGTIGLAVTAIGAAIIRELGVRAESKLIDEWGGLPSTVIMRWRDTTKSCEYKTIMHNMVEKNTGINLLTAQEEKNDPQDVNRHLKLTHHRHLILTHPMCQF